MFRRSYYYYYYYCILTLFSRRLMLTLIFLRIIINFCPYIDCRILYFVLLIIFMCFCVLVLTLYLASVLLSLHVNKNLLPLPGKEFMFCSLPAYSPPLWQVYASPCMTVTSRNSLNRPVAAQTAAKFIN
jgi:hypothetical protein